MSYYDEIRAWARARGIYDQGDPKTQLIKLQEEVGELARSILKQDEIAQVDAIGDCIIVLTNLAHLCGHEVEDCIVEAFEAIKNRQGRMQNGTFVKDVD